MPGRVLRRLFTVLIATAVALLGAVTLAPTAGAATPKSTATAKEYKRIKKGQTLKKVRKVIGGKGENVTTGAQSQGSYVYLWRSTAGKDVYVRFAKGKVTKKKRVTDKTVSYAEEKKIKKGQSYGKVKSISRTKAAWSDYDGGTGYWRVWCSSNNRDYLLGYFWKDKLQTNGLEFVEWWNPEPGWPTCKSPV